MKNQVDIERHSVEIENFAARPSRRQRSRGRPSWSQVTWQLGLGLVLLAVVLVSVRRVSRAKAYVREVPKTLHVVSYAYSEGSPHEMRNLEFFLRHGVFEDPNTLFFIVSNGGHCTPCKMREAARSNVHIAQRENYGHDFGAHGYVLNHLEVHGLLARLKRFYCLNASVRGPFLPKYARKRPWTTIFDALFRDNVAAVGASLVCLPKEDAGGPGARLEGFAFALSDEGVRAARRAGVFRPYRTKKETILYGEFGLTDAIFRAGLSVDTLMTKYQRIWNTSNEMASCNRHVFPSRSGALDGIDLHPYEIVFVKTQWHVSYPYTLLYSEWMDRPDASEPSDLNAYRYFQHDDRVHPIEAPRLASPPIGQKKLVVVSWDRPASSLEWDNIVYFMEHIHRSDKVDYLLIVRDAQVARLVHDSHLDEYPNVQMILDDSEDITSLCLQGLSVLRMNSRYMSYNFFVFVTQHARGPIGTRNGGMNWLQVLESRHSKQKGGLLFSFIHNIDDSLQPDPSFFCTDHRGLTFLLRERVCGSRGALGTMKGMKRVAAGALSRSVPFGSMQPGEPVLNNLGTLTDPNLRGKFAKSLPELTREELEELIFVPVASICISDSAAIQLLQENIKRMRLSSSVASAAPFSSVARLENSSEQRSDGKQLLSRRLDDTRAQSPAKQSGSQTGH